MLLLVVCISLIRGVGVCVTALEEVRAKEHQLEHKWSGEEVDVT